MRYAKLLLIILVAFIGCSPPPAPSPQSPEIKAFHKPGRHHHKHRSLMAREKPRRGRSHAQVRLNDAGAIERFDVPQGLTPANLVQAYAIPAGGAGVTVAIVDAMDNPNAERDLNVYRSTFHLPPCTTANGCFRKVNQNGAASPLPSVDVDWAGEISLDLDMVSAACPACKILLVEAETSLMVDLGAAVTTAVAMGVNIISMSFGGDEDAEVLGEDAAFFSHAGITYVASSGDNGYGSQYPATGAHVLAVGGTTLVPASGSRGWSESAWAGSGSGCSKYVAKPSWQTDACTKRVEADVSAVADPDTGVAVYDAFGGDPSAPWMIIGGTSAATPIVAGIIAATGRAGIDASWFYAHPGVTWDVTDGSNGSCSPAILCEAGVGWDGPTGLGSPNGAAIVSGLPTTVAPAPPAGCAKTP